MTRLLALLLACHAVLQASSALLPPRNLSLYSKNFEHILQWEDPNNEFDVYYRVTCSKMYADYETVKDCANLTTRLCNLTKAFTNISNHYRVRVSSFTDYDSSKPSTSLSLTPKQKTVLGPPVVDVTACDRCIEVSVQPPVCHLWSAEKQQSVSMLHAYPSLEYHVRLLRRAEEISAFDVTIYEENYTFNQSNLLPNANYCVSVSVTAAGNKHSVPSELKCVVIEYRANESRTALVVGIVCGVLVLILLVLGLFLLDRAGCICMVKTLIPKALKSIPTSKSSYIAGSEFTSSTFFSPVDVISKKLEVEQDPESEAKSYEEGYERRVRLQKSDTSSAATSGEFPSGVSSSVGSSGQATSSAEEAHSASEHGSSATATPPVRATEDSANLPFNTSGVFNVNLNTVSIASPASAWTGFQQVEAPLEESEDSMESNTAGISLDQHNPIGLGVGDLDVEFCSDEEEEDSSENGDSDNHLISGYMRR